MYYMFSHASHGFCIEHAMAFASQAGTFCETFSQTWHVLCSIHAGTGQLLWCGVGGGRPFQNCQNAWLHLLRWLMTLMSWHVFLAGSRSFMHTCHSCILWAEGWNHEQTPVSGIQWTSRRSYHLASACTTLALRRALFCSHGSCRCWHVRCWDGDAGFFDRSCTGLGEGPRHAQTCS